MNLAREGDHLLITNYETWLNASFNEHSRECREACGTGNRAPQAGPNIHGLAVFPPEQFQEVVVVFLGHVFTSPRFQT